MISEFSPPSALLCSLSLSNLQGKIIPGISFLDPKLRSLSLSMGELPVSPLRPELVELELCNTMRNGGVAVFCLFKELLVAKFMCEK